MKEFLVKLGHKVLEHSQELAIATIAVFAPVHKVMVVALTLIAVDLITGLIAAKKTGQNISSAGIKRTVGKVLLYETAICVTFLIEHYLTGDIFPASKLVSALIGLVEGKSVLENLDRINGSPMFRTILDRIIQTQNNLGKKD